jgi:ankyrin repeat protein
MWEIQKLLLDSLIFDEIESRYDTIKPALSQTCVWFPQSGNYQAWQDPAEYASHHGFLWISGKPGAGKSTMMKFLFAQMQKTSGSDPDTAVVAFFFNARGVELEKSTEGMYRSLLFHILEAFPDLACFLGFRAQQKSITWTLPKLQQAFRAVIENLGHRRLTCFIDALDECDEGQITDMVGTLEDLGNAAFQNATQFYACLSSRHYPHVQIQPCLRTVLEQQAGHSRDIEAYVHSKLRSKTSGAAVNEVAGIILSKAAGVFIWVVLVVETLRDAFSRGDVLFIKRHVQELPSELGKLFATIISRDAVNMDRFLLCVQWILFAERPLTREEFFFALHSGINPELETLMAWNPDYITKEHMELFVLSSSKGLAELTKASVPTVQFIHESVRDFFLKDDGTEKLWPDSSQGQHFAATSHDRLRACCEFYTSVDTSTVFPARISVVDAPMAIVMPLQTAISKAFPFLEYANTYIFVHANSGSSTSTPQDEFLRRFDFSSWLRVHIVFEKVGGCRHTLDAGHVYLFAENNWTELLRLALQMGLPVESPQETWKHPMLVAVAKDHELALSLLLAKVPRSQDTLGRTPLSYAAENDLQQVVKKLLDNMPDALESDLSDRTSLSYAIKRGHNDLAKLMIIATSDTYTDVGDAEGRTPLSHAAELGAQGLIPLLTKLPDVGLNARDKEGRTPLAWAALSGHSGVARLMKDLEGVMINSQDNSGRTPLAWAVLSRNALVVEDILSVSGVQVNLRDSDGRTALSLAAEIGNHRILTHLLMVRDINVNLCDNGGRAPLAWAAVSHDNSLITGCLLAVSGIQVNLQDNSGRTPLSLAAEFHNHQIVFDLLTTRGIDVNLGDSSGRTPLSWVVAKSFGPGGWETVRMLLKIEGVDVNV